MRLHRLGTKVYSSVWVRLLEGTFWDGWSNVFQLGVKHSPYMSQSPKPSPNPTVSLFSQPLSVSAAADDFAGVSRLPLSSSCLRSPAPIGLCTVPASKLRTNSGLAPPPLSLVPGPQPLPADRARPGFVECICSTKHKVSKPQRPTPALIRARDKSPKRARERFLEPPFSGWGWDLVWGLFLLNKQTFLWKAHFLEFSYRCRQPSPASELRNHDDEFFWEAPLFVVVVKLYVFCAQAIIMNRAMIIAHARMRMSNSFGCFVYSTQCKC